MPACSSTKLIQWASPPACTALGDDEVHIWWVALDLPEFEMRDLGQILNDSERKRAGRFRFDSHRNRYVAGRALLRVLLGRYMNRHPREIELEFGPLGKPAVSDQTARLCFNYSDSRGMALYAFSSGRELGIDLEHLQRRVNHDRIATRKFSVTEAEALGAMAESERCEAFLACWTRKEAYGKAEGVGIHYPLSSVELCVDMDTQTQRLPKLDALGDDFWSLKQLYPHPDYVGALVVEGSGWDIKAWKLR